MEGRTKTIKREAYVSRHDTRLLVVANALFKKVGLALQTNHLHPGKWVLGIVKLGAAQAEQQAVSAKFNVGGHHARIHACRRGGEGETQKEIAFLNI